MHRAGLLLALAVAVAGQAAPAAADGPMGQVSGTVFEVMDPGDPGLHGPGLPGVAVSNGRDIVRTDADGAFAIGVRPGDTVFLIRPAGFDLPVGADGLPAFWRHHQPVPGPALRYGGLPVTDATAGPWALGLRARPAPAEREEVLVFADPQPANREQVDHYARDIVEPIIGKHPAVLGLTLGDVVHGSALDLLPAVNAATTRLEVPWLHAAGNHDVDPDAATDADSLLSFRAVYGPDTFAWEEAHARFVVLDNVVHRPDGLPGYIGGLREDQFTFLANYLADADDRLLVVAAHIPFFDTHPGRETFRAGDRERLFALLADQPRVLLLTGHGHLQRHHFHGPDTGWHGEGPLHEYNVGAACGGFWGGPPDAAGIPEALMADGTPNGYGVLGIAAGGGYDLRWYAAREPDDHAIALHAPQVLRQGAWPGVYLYANVFMGIAGDRVEARIGGGDWQPMAQVARMDPRVLAHNLADDAADRLRGRDRVPEARDSTHLWRIALPTDLPLGEHAIEVRAFDRWRGELRAGTRYRLEAWD